MAKKAKSLEREESSTTPESLMTGFSQSRFGPCIMLAVALHLAIIGATSLRYLHGLIDPEAAAQAKAEADAQAKAKAEATTPAPVAPAAKTEAAPPAAKTGTTTDAQLEAHKDAPVVQRITEAAKKSEIPSEPDGGLGLDLESTNPKR
ncbi:MAG: hypothetical protein AMXMBFR7_29300 [Planctomycetota bacterium]